MSDPRQSSADGPQQEAADDADPRQTAAPEAPASPRDGRRGGDTGAAEADGPARTPAEALLASLQRTLQDILPARGPSSAATPPEGLLRDAMDGLRPALNGFLTEFELVPRRELEGYLASVERLRQTVSSLEARIAELEQSERPAD